MLEKLLLWSILISTLSRHCSIWCSLTNGKEIYRWKFNRGWRCCRWHFNRFVWTFLSSLHRYGKIVWFIFKLIFYTVISSYSFIIKYIIVTWINQFTYSWPFISSRLIRSATSSPLKLDMFSLLGARLLAFS